MKILIFIDRLSSGGAPKALKKIAQHISETHKLYLTTNYTCRDENLYGFADLPIDFIPSPIKKESNLFWKVLSFFRYLYHIQKQCKKYHIHTCISFLERSNIVNILISKWLHLVSVISVRNNLTMQYKSKSFLDLLLIKFSIKVTYNWADHIIAVTKSVKDDLVNNYKVNNDSLCVIGNPFNLDQIQLLASRPVSQELFDKNCFNCITVGRLSHQKGHWHLIRSFKNFLKYNKNAKLTIIGEGEYEHKLKSMCINMHIDQHVKIIGYQTNPYKYIAASDVFILTSLYEGIANVLIEAMICKTIIIATACDGGARDLFGVAHKNLTSTLLTKYGFLIPEYKNNSVNFGSRTDEQEILLSDTLNNIRNRKYNLEEIKENAFSLASTFSEQKIFSLWDSLLSDNSSND